MKFPVRLSIRSKLVVTLLLTSIISILIVAYQGYRSAQDALAEATNNELKTLRAAKTDRKSTRLNSSHTDISRMPSSA